MKKSFPNIRLRRLRANSSIRNLVRENVLSPFDLIQPLFVVEGKGKIEKILRKNRVGKATRSYLETLKQKADIKMYF